MWYIMNKEIRKAYKEAYEKAEEIRSKICYDKDKDELIPTAEIIRAVEKAMNVDVKFTTYDFKKLINKKTQKSLNMEKYGAAMGVQQNVNQKEAIILLNEDENIQMQRFSLVHELGHLMLQGDNNFKDGFRISTHINMDLTSIPTEILEKAENRFLVEEQQANIFALLVLIPSDMFERVKEERDSISEMAKIFGVEKNAIFSRLMLERP